MSEEMTEAEIAWSAMRHYADPEEKLTAQQEHLVFLLASGIPAPAACKAAGYKGTQAMRNPKVQNAVKFVRTEQQGQVKVNRDKLTAMLFSAHAKAANATEEIAAIRELGKMHDVYAQAQEDRKNNVHTAVQINNNTVHQLSDADLLRIAELSSDLTPTPAVLEHDSTPVLEHDGD